MGKRFRLPAAAFNSPARGYQPRAGEIGMVSLAINLLRLAIALVTMQVYDRILVHHNFSTLNLLCLGAAVALLTEAALNLCRAYAMGWSAAAFEHAVACNAVRHTLAQEVSATEKLGVGEYLQRLGAISKIRDFYSGQSLATLIDLPFTIIFLLIIAYIGGALVFAPILLLAVMGVRAVSLGRRLKTRLRRRDDADDARYNFLIETLSGVHTVKALGLEAPFERRYEHWQAASTRANFEVARLSAAAYDHGVIASHTMMIAVAIVGAPMALNGDLTLGALVACVILAGRIMQPTQRALGFWTRLQDMELAHRRLSEHFATPELKETAPAIAEIEGRVELKNVSFAYPGQEAVLEGVNLSLAPGEAISVSGEHGGGKQTLLNLIAGLHRPDTGQILVDGVEPHLYRSEELVTHIGYLPAVGVIFRGTIYENLSRFGCVPRERVTEMAELLGLNEEIAALPAGFDTKLEGTHSDAIPPGLRQRIAIARVIAAKPRVLLFYNADRALDREGYNSVYRLLARLKGRATMVLVTNDQNIRHLATRHIRIENRRLVERPATQLYDVLAYQELRI